MLLLLLLMWLRMLLLAYLQGRQRMLLVLLLLLVGDAIFQRRLLLYALRVGLLLGNCVLPLLLLLLILRHPRMETGSQVSCEPTLLLLLVRLLLSGLRRTAAMLLGDIVCECDNSCW